MTTKVEPDGDVSLDQHLSPESDSISTEELLVDKLDKFVASIESRLDNFEQFFKFKSEETEKAKEQNLSTMVDTVSRSRRGSTASMSSIKSYSISNLSLIHQRLSVIKDSVLRTSFTNLEMLYKTLDDQYNYLFSSNLADDSGSEKEETASSNRKEVLSRKIITTIQYFDDKLLQIDDFIKDNKPEGKVDYDLDSSLLQLRFFNFNKALKSAETRYLHYYEMPLSWRENKYIIHGYRFSLHHSSMLKSIFHFNHNETMNIWTHIFGFFLISYLALWHFPSTDVYKVNSFHDNLAVYVFFAAAIKCLVSSITWHTYSCFAHLPIRSTCACVDYTGITVLITCSIIVAEYCSLYNYPKLLATYITFSSICGMTGFIFNWSPYFDKPECRSIRIGFFMGLAFLGATAGLCMAYYEGVSYAFWFFIPLVYKSFSWYWLGVIFYGGLIPERWRYDVIIEQNSTCNHHYDSRDVFMDNVEKSGIEEMEVIEEEMDLVEEKHLPDDEEESRFKEIISEHFPKNPTMTPYSRDFLSLWWVDYFLASHNIWHICVVLGIVGHYFSVLDMFRNIDRVLV
ncbi:hemolysin-III related-domain-containing protein [Scheffersomyces xylosifermentans]|uniref:hemolysin-III related-domain-containing protein n=1 Tax=Scheffersomyces xylosifermentans TaxID=1304137 RepID=UPI00315DD333